MCKSGFNKNNRKKKKEIEISYLSKQNILLKEENELLYKKIGLLELEIEELERKIKK